MITAAAWKICYFAYGRFNMGARVSLMRRLGDMALSVATRNA